MDTYTLAVVVEEGLELDDVGVAHDAHDLQLAVLCAGVSEAARALAARGGT